MNRDYENPLEGPTAALIDALRDALGSDAVITGDAVRSRSAGLWGPARTLTARVLVRPSAPEGVARCLALCHAAGQTVVTHGGLTGTVEGADAGPTDLILSLERLRTIEEIDPVQRAVVAQAGVPLEMLQQAVAAEGLLFPLDLGARGSATIGGNAATNAGGNQVLRFGMMRNLILGLEAVLADGTVVSSMNRVLKNNAGYDVKQLFIGSEGTLGVVTRLVLRLVPRPATQDTALVAVDSFDALAALLSALDTRLGGKLSSFEALWGDFYRFTLAAGGHSSPLPSDHAYYALVESWGSDAARDPGQFEAAMGEALEQGLVRDAVIAKSGAERERLWAIRDDVEHLLELQPLFLFDVSLPLRAMAGYVESINAAVSERWPDATVHTFGHLGDGNLHVAVSAGRADGSAREAVEHIVYRPLGELGGSVSGEHGIGLEKRAYLDWCRSPEEIALMRTLKASLDPKNILNPGKVI